MIEFFGSSRFNLGISRPDGSQWRGGLKQASFLSICSILQRINIPAFAGGKPVRVEPSSELLTYRKLN